MWASKRIFLRQLQMADLPYLLQWENDPENWEVSDTTTPYTEAEMIDFIVEQNYFLSTGQLRLMICLQKKDLPIGAIDLFDIDPIQRSAGVGILIQEKKFRRKGYASEALITLRNFCINELKLEHLHCCIHTTNLASIQLFLNCGFKQISEKEGIIQFELILI